MNRDWDSQSLYSDSAGSSTTTATGSAATFQGTSVEYLRDLVQKRIITLTYVRNTHEGSVICCALLCQLTHCFQEDTLVSYHCHYKGRIG